jgi:hypothetical protein
MEPLELTVEQCRFIAAVRARNPRADVRVHRTRAGVILEVRQGRRVELARVDAFGRVRHDRHVRTLSRLPAPRRSAAPPPRSAPPWGTSPRAA